MATKVTARTTFDAVRVIESIYTGGEVSSSGDGSLLATTVDDDVLVVRTLTGEPLVRIEGDGEGTTSLVLSPVASHLIICSRSLSMRVFSLAYDGESMTAELLRTLKPHSAPVISTAIDRSGSLLTTGGADGIVKVWDISGGYCSHTFHGHGGLVTALELFEMTSSSLRQKSSSSRKRKIQDSANHTAMDIPEDTTIVLASGGEDGKIKVYDLSTKATIATLDSHVSVVRSIKFSSAQQALLSVSRDKTITVWDTQVWSARRVIPALETLEAGGFVADTRYCYSGGDNGRLRIWNTETGQEVTSEQEPGLETESVVTIVEVSAESALLTIHQDQNMMFHSTKGLEDLPPRKVIPPLPKLRTVSGNHDEIIDMVCIGPDQTRLALATNTESVKILSIVNSVGGGLTTNFGSDVALLEGHKDIILCLDVDWSGHWLATGAKDNTARLWRLDPATATYECFAQLQGHAESLGAVALPHSAPPGGGALKEPLNHPPPFLITGSQDKTIKKWDTSKLTIQKAGSTPHNVVKSVFTRVAHEKDINAIDISPIAPLFASASQDRSIKIWSIDDGSTTGILRGHKRGVWSVQFSPDRTPALSLAEGGTSSNRGLLVSGSGDRTVKIWSLSSYTCLLTFEGHSNSVLKVIWLPPPIIEQISDDGSQQRQVQKQPMIASASADTLVKIWTPYASPDSDHLLTTLDNHTDRVWSLASPKSHASSGATKTPGLKSSTSSSSAAQFTLISGAADASITFWKDTTTATAAAASKHLTERIEQDQLLQNHIHKRNYRESITLALTLNHPGRLLRIIEDIVNLPEAQKEPDSIMGVKTVDEVLSTLGTFELYKLLERIRDWNTNARTAPIAQRLLHVILKAYPASKWSDMSKNQRRFLTASTDPTSTAPNASASEDATTSDPQARKSKPMSMQDLFRALEVYTERHYKRMEELVDESYLIEYTLREMDEVAGADLPATDNLLGQSMINGNNNNHNHMVNDAVSSSGGGGTKSNKDIIML